MNGKMTQEEYLEHIGKMTEDEREEELMRRAGELRGKIWDMVQGQPTNVTLVALIDLITELWKSRKAVG
jgi:hypothetical protein